MRNGTVAKVSICIEMLLTEHDFYQRPARAAALGFKAIEFWGTSGKDIPRLKAACEEAGVAVAGFVGPCAFAMVNEHTEAELAAAMKESAGVAHQLGAQTLIITTGNAKAGVAREEQTDAIVGNLKVLAPLAEAARVKLAVEMLNTLVDHKGYFLDHTADGRRIVDRVGSPAVGLLYDVYHMQVMEGNLIQTIRDNAAVIHHVHAADVPGRREPGSGEINYANVFKALDEAGYKGYCGFEFRPSDNSESALKRAKAACGLR
jgi:hydroxypyruvate isomerase